MTIKQYREELGMTQAQLAAALGVAQNHISRWEHGTVNPSTDTLRKMAEIFSCRMDDITPAVKKLKAKDIFTREAYEGLTADQRRRELFQSTRPARGATLQTPPDKAAGKAKGPQRRPGAD